VSASQSHHATADAERWLGDRWVSLNRGNLGFGHDAIMTWNEAGLGRPKFLLKLKLTRLVRTALHRLKEGDWQGPAIFGAYQIAQARIQLTGWKPSAGDLRMHAARVGAAAYRAEFWDQHTHEFAVYVTNLLNEVNGWQIQELYRQWADTETRLTNSRASGALAAFARRRGPRPNWLHVSRSWSTTFGRSSCASSCPINTPKPGAAAAGSC
jgi:hypothetical protein